MRAPFKDDDFQAGIQPARYGSGTHARRIPTDDNQPFPSRHRASSCQPCVLLRASILCRLSKTLTYTEVRKQGEGNFFPETEKKAWLLSEDLVQALHVDGSPEGVLKISDSCTHVVVRSLVSPSVRLFLRQPRVPKHHPACSTEHKGV